ncbi:alpha-1,3-mannosyl-glycoprotein 4-beta-N-acetylglucosaminyltransferase-like protein MGAT4E [Octodon degus]|uniref:Alpha-1,3-mannosyl-glycoprotein 4-beta-N-acetylglucosaminyltransferase-like protein MGAT4E n=1 Tax=Octodon degus TaxID=10160 RepID=A0A6P3V8N9_OCTDE|nr:alpha-1,3-mannosyl-glycoprotein 4-beta-N-acetylglucosaminyltransferase-like protein MGAT4E [Octodon degus]
MSPARAREPGAQGQLRPAPRPPPPRRAALSRDPGPESPAAHAPPREPMSSAVRSRHRPAPGIRRSSLRLIPELLTVGIPSVQRPHGTYLLATLRSLFQASSAHDLECMLVLVHLSDPDPAWLRQSPVSQRSSRRTLLVVHGLLGGSALRHENQFSTCQSLYSRQKVDYALLMHFASNLSEYFLLMQDRVRCAPRFLSAIYWAALAWKDLPWVVLEFSSLRLSGRVFHMRDLTHLASFFLLFPEDTPTHPLPSNFASSWFGQLQSYLNTGG